MEANVSLTYVSFPPSLELPWSIPRSSSSCLFFLSLTTISPFSFSNFLLSDSLVPFLTFRSLYYPWPTSKMEVQEGNSKGSRT